MKSYKEFLQKLKNDKRLLIMLLLGVIGVSLILLSELSIQKPEKEESQTEKSIFYEYEEQTEKRLAQIISEINDVGRVKVMLTLKSTQENKYAYNETDQIKTDENLRDSKTENEYVIINGENGEECILLKTEFPQVQGVIVVCDGGDNSRVKNDVTNAVSALLNINSNSISVLKMKSSED